MMKMQLRGWLILGGALALAGLSCSPFAISTGGVEKVVEESEGEGNEGESIDAPSETAADLLINVPGVDEVTLTTPQEGVGVKPRFAWQPLDGAERYMLVVYAPDRRSYWAWAGEETSVYLGGGDTPPPDDSAGPVLVPGMWWAVMAFDADGVLIGSSAVQPISP